MVIGRTFSQFLVGVLLLTGLNALLSERTAQFTTTSGVLETKLGVNQVSVAVVNKGLLLLSAGTISFNAAH